MSERWEVAKQVVGTCNTCGADVTAVVTVNLDLVAGLISRGHKPPALDTVEVERLIGCAHLTDEDLDEFRAELRTIWATSCE